MLYPYPILRLTIPIAAGIFFTGHFSGCVPMAVWWVLTLAGGAGLGFLALQRKALRSLWFGVGAMLVCFCIGALLMEHAWQKVRIDWPAEKQVYEAVVQRYPQEKARSVRVDASVGEKQVLLYLPKDSAALALSVGDRLLIYGILEQPVNRGNPSEFDYARYCLLHGISGSAWIPASCWQKMSVSEPLTLQQKASRFQRKITHQYDEWRLGDEERAVLSALTTGDKSDLDEELRQDFSTAGIAHVLALSGMHIGILWLLIDFLLRPLRRRAGGLKWLLSAALLIAFAFVTGLQPSVIRAVLMCLLLEFGRLLHRPLLSMNTLSMAALVMLLFHPAYLFDVGFQLSFVAVASILLLYPSLYARMPRSPRLFRPLWNLLCISIAAQLGTAPLSLLYFSQFSIYFLITNLVAAVLVPFILYGCVLAGCLFFLPSVQQLVVSGLNLLLKALNASAHAVSLFPGAGGWEFLIHPAEVWIFYGFLLAASLYLCSPRRKRMLCLWGAALCVLLTHIIVQFPVRQRPEICFYHLPSCSAIHLIEPDGSSYLASDRPDTVMQCLKPVSQSFWREKKLSAPVILPDSVHTGKVVWQHQILSWRGRHLALFTDDSWKRKEAQETLDLDYAVIGRGFKGNLSSLLQVFTIRQVVLEASLYDSQAARLEKECELLRIPCFHLSTEGSWRIPL